MKKNFFPTKLPTTHFLFLLCLMASFILIAACNKHREPKGLKDFAQVNLVANNDQYGAVHIDPILHNAWGLAFSSGGTPWVNSMLGHVSAVYDKEGAIVRPAVNIPSPVAPTGGFPTGVVFSGSTSNFILANGQPARFIFVGVDGVLSAWNGAAGGSALRIKDNSATSAYTGLAIANNAGATYLYAANFRAGKIDVWDKNFAPVSMPFTDNHIPAGYAPFNIQEVDSLLYVMYAKVGPDGRDQKGVGNGFVDVYKTDGSLKKRFAARGALNSPWGVAMASMSFFADMNADNNDDKDNSGHSNSAGIKHGDDDNEPILLVGNFGDGRINAYNAEGDFVGQLRSHGRTVVIDGLWAISFPPATATAIDPNRLYFTAGPNAEADGLFGYLIKL